MRQRTIFEWNIAGNPNAETYAAGNVTSTLPSTSTSATISQAMRKPRDQCVIPDEDPGRALSLDADDEEGHPFDLMGDGVGDEDDGGEDEDDEHQQDARSNKTMKHKTLPPAVKDQYDKHLEYLKQMPHGARP